MKFFVLKFLSFLLFAILILVVISVYNRFYTYNDGYFKVYPSTKYIFVGDSHIECAINRDMDSSINVGQSAEIYLHTYYKLQMLLNENSNIRTIFVDFCNFQITGGQDSILFDSAYLTKRYRTYMPFYSLKDLWMLLNYNPRGLLNAHFKSLVPCLFHGIYYTNFSQDNFVGGYQKLTNRFIENSNSLNNGMSVETSLSTELSVLNLYYLDQIVDLCKQNDVQLYFIRTPINNKWEYLMLEPQYQELLKTRYKDLVLLDFKDYPLNSSDYADREHLNQSGAVKFSNFLNELIQKGLLFNANKQEFINGQIKQINYN